MAGTYYLESGRSHYHMCCPIAVTLHHTPDGVVGVILMVKYFINNTYYIVKKNAGRRPPKFFVSDPTG